MTASPPRAQPIDTRGTATTDAFPPLTVCAFHFRALDPIRPAGYLGSAWRGLLGRGLRRTACITRLPTCEACLLNRTCVYSTLFESPPPDPPPRTRFTAIPHPFVLAPDPPNAETLVEGAEIRLGITLIGAAGSALPHLIHALQDAGQGGIGTHRSRFRIHRVEQLRDPEQDRWTTVYAGTGALQPAPPLTTQIPPMPGGTHLDLHLITPLRIKSRGRLVTPEAFRWADFVRHLLWRLQALSLFYGNGEPDLDAAALVRAAAPVDHQSTTLRWQDWTRYSSRQRTTMQMGGLLGSFRLPRAAAEALWPWLWLGQWTHVGKATSMGLGRYRIQGVDHSADG